MDRPGCLAGDGKTSPTRRDLQGPRPAPLRVNKDSHKIRKPSRPPLPPGANPQPAPAPARAAPGREPVVIYAVSPKIIHVAAEDFSSLVQRLTGSSSSSSSSSISTSSSSSLFPGEPSNAGDLSPAARFASMQKISPSERERERENTNEFVGLIEGIELCQNPGILSPAPSALPTLPTGIFSPETDPISFSFINDVNPFSLANSVSIPSPSTLLSAPLISPSPSSLDFINWFLDL